jgi:hypothetical protein
MHNVPPSLLMCLRYPQRSPIVFRAGGVAFSQKAPRRHGRVLCRRPVSGQRRLARPGTAMLRASLAVPWSSRPRSDVGLYFVPLQKILGLIKMFSTPVSCYNSLIDI